MNWKRATFVLATMLLSLAAPMPAGSVARAAGCGKCHYRPENLPTLTDSETFGYHPTVWQLWPGPLDPNTTYPSISAAQSAPATVKEILARTAIKRPSASTYTTTPPH